MELGRILSNRSDMDCITLRNCNIDDDACQMIVDALKDSQSKPEVGPSDLI